jgi:hypothetical protein
MKYKNALDCNLEVIGVGLVKAGETIETDQEIRNGNLQLVIETAKAIFKPIAEPVESKK